MFDCYPIHSIQSPVVTLLKSSTFAFQFELAMTDAEQPAPPIPSSLSSDVWTLDQATSFLNLTDDDVRLSFIQTLLSVESHAYSYEIPSTFLVDYHLGNALFCQESGFSAVQTEFVCRSLGILLSEAIIPLHPHPDYDRLRLRLIRSLRAMFLARRELFTYTQVQDICRHVASCIIRPLRLIVWSFNHAPFIDPFLELRKVWAPPSPPALAEFTDDTFPEIPMRFDAEKGAAKLDAYWDRLMTVVDRRCLTIEEKMKALGESLEEEGGEEDV
jgi:hypothetical protein